MANYGNLRATIAEMRKAAEDERAAPLVECPFDGTRLEVKDGVYNCPMGNFRTRKALRAQ